MLLKPFDFGIFITALCVIVISFVYVYGGAGGRPIVNLKGDGGEWVFSMDAMETLGVSGPLGETLVEISGGRARITFSPCANQTCVATGAIRLPGQWAVCLPNRVMLYIDETRVTNEVDAVAW